MSKELTIVEQTQYDADKAIIRKGEKTFIEVGTALLRIRSTRSYRGEYKTFELFCQNEFGWTRVRGHQLIKSAEAVATLPKDLLTLVNNEKQARELIQVPFTDRSAVVQLAATGGTPVTAETIKEAAEAVKSPEDQINFLFSQLCKIEGTPDKVLLLALNNIRQIGCLMEGLMGRKHSWEKPKFRTMADKLPIDFEQAKVCLTIYLETPDLATLQDASRFSEEIFSIMGKIEKEDEIPKTQVERSSEVVITGILETARGNVEKRLKVWEQLTILERGRIRGMLVSHSEWAHNCHRT